MRPNHFDRVLISRADKFIGRNEILFKPIGRRTAKKVDFENERIKEISRNIKLIDDIYITFVYRKTVAYFFKLFNINVFRRCWLICCCDKKNSIILVLLV